MDESTASSAAVDTVLGGRLALRQPARGHRAGTDAILLAASAAPTRGDIVVDIGSGVGTVGLLLAQREPGATVRLLEREPGLAALARENALMNGLADSVRVIETDLFDLAWSGRRAADADLVVSNPPFYAGRMVRHSPEPLRAAAHVLAAGQASRDVPGHGDWLSAMLHLVRPGGQIVVIHRPEALPALLAAGEGRLGCIRIRPVQARSSEAAMRILFGGVAGSRAPLAIVRPLVLHEASGGFTAEAAALHAGEAILPLIEPAPRKSRPRRPALSR